MSDYPLLSPLLSEKSNSLATQGRYVFWVRKEAPKLRIKQAVEARYGVRVKGVNTLISQRRLKRKYLKHRVVEGHKPAYKKAIVSLQAGDMIDFYATDK